MSKLIITLIGANGETIGTASVPIDLDRVEWMGHFFQAPGFKYGTPSTSYHEVESDYKIPDDGVTVA